MARQADIVRTTDICDDHGRARACGLRFRDAAIPLAGPARD